MSQVPLFDDLRPEPLMNSGKGAHRYRRTGDGSKVCKRCGVEQRDAPTGRKGGFATEWQVRVNGQDVWTRECPSCVAPKRKR